MTGIRRTAAMVVVVDLLVALVIMLTAILALTTISRKHTPPSIPVYGKYVVVVDWPDGNKDDVDTYVEDPQDHIASFLNPQIGLMHLEQDDLGTGTSDSATVGGKQVAPKRNEERVIIKGIVPGEYTVDVHLFTKRQSGPVAVTVKLVRLEGHDATVISQKVVLLQQGNEKTAFRFTLRANGTWCCKNQISKDLVYANSAGTASAGNGTVPPFFDPNVRN
jgi:hypothetical protein